MVRHGVMHYMSSKNKISQTANNCVNIQTVNCCQLNCPGCRGSISKKDLSKLSCNTLMSTGEFIQIVDKCIDEGITQFHLVPTIGDPFLDRGIFDKLDYVQKYKVENLSKLLDVI